MSLRMEIPRWPAVAVALLVFGCEDNQSTPTDPAESAPFPSPSTAIATAAKVRSGTIVFSTDRDGNSEIYTMSPGGKNVTRLTNDPGPDSYPQWSLDGSKLVFVRNGDVFVMNPDGSGQTNLTNSPAPDAYPSWSPDGSKIVFSSFLDGGFISRLYVMNADGSNVVRITSPDPAHDLTPAWSPSGDRIAFVRHLQQGGGSPIGDIFVVNPDGSGLTNLTNNQADYSTPSWSPDGLKIAFSGQLPEVGQSSEVFVMNADGSGRVDVSNNPAYDFDPDWSPDGSKLVFTSARVLTPHNYDIFVMDADGRHQRSLTGNSLANETSPDWSP
jgi:Tol biopolymer transport system component